jgi:chromosome partitioning protein
VRPGLDLIPATIRLSYLENELANVRLRREDRLKTALATLADRYDYALLDCPPSLGIFTINALVATDAVLIPMSPDYLALLGVELVLTTIADIREELNHQLAVLGILPTRVARTTNARESLDQAREQFAPAHRLLAVAIPETVKFREAAGLGRTIFEHAPETAGAQAYHQLVTEVLHDV